MSFTKNSRLREERLRKGFTQSHAGKLGGVSLVTQQRYEKDKGRVPDADYLELLWGVYDVPYIITGIRSVALAEDSPDYNTQPPVLWLCRIADIEYKPGIELMTLRDDLVIVDKDIKSIKGDGAYIFDRDGTPLILTLRSRLNGSINIHNGNPGEDYSIDSVDEIHFPVIGKVVYTWESKG